MDDDERRLQRLNEQLEVKAQRANLSRTNVRTMITVR